MGLNQSSLQRLQLVQDAAAWLLTKTRNHERITPVLASLPFKVDFKILLFVLKVLNGLAPSYLCELIDIHSSQLKL